MNIEELQSEWAADAQIDKKALDDEALKIPKLHSKYYHVFISERLKLMALKNQLIELEHILDQFYQKTLTMEELEEYGLEYEDKKVLKPDVPKWIQSNKDVIKLKTKIGLANEKVDFLKSILNQLGNRSFLIRDAIEFAKFTAGF